MKLKVVRRFSAAHWLNDYKGKCSKLHGHTWRVVFLFKLRDPESTYYSKVTIDFGKLKEALDKLLPDHQCLNESLPINPTAENLAIWLRFEVADMLIKQKLAAELEEVEVWESEDCAAIN